MSTKRFFFKKATCFIAILLLMLTFSSTKAQASERSKTVTYERNYTIFIVPSQFPKYMSSPSSYVPSTHNYNEGNIRELSTYNMPTVVLQRDYQEIIYG